MMKIILALAMGLLMASCSSTPSMQPQAKYYLLDSLPVVSMANENDAELNKADSLIAIKAISVPAYLDQPNLVMRQADQQILIANYHSWADALPDSIRRVLRDELNRSAENFRIVDSCQGCRELTIAIQHFYPTTEGQVFLAGSYTLHNLSQQAPQQHDFTLSSDMQYSGYDEAVKQMRQLLLALAQRINGTL